VHTFTVSVNRDNDPPGHATYTLLEDGKPVTNFSGLDGGWDDTTPWESKLYTNVPVYPNDPNGFYNGVPAWSFTIPNREGILLHTDFGSATSKPSVGCLVAPPGLLQEVRQLVDQNKKAVANYNSVLLPKYYADLANYNATYGTNIQPAQSVKPVRPPTGSINIDVHGNDQPATITMSAITSSSSGDGEGNSNSFVKLRLGLTKKLSKDVWVFIKVSNPDDPNNAEFTPKNLQNSVLVLDDKGNPLTDPGGAVNLGSGSVRYGNVASQVVITGDKGKQNLNPGDKNQNGFWVRIAAGTTSEEVDVKPAYKKLQYDAGGGLIKGPDRTETFTIADYGIRYDGNGSREPSLYQDGLNAPGKRASNLLTGGQPTESPVNVTISDQALDALGNGYTLVSYDPRAKAAQSWTVGMDPDKDHTITARAWGYPDNPAPLRVWATVLDLHGQRHIISLVKTSASTYTISAASLKGTEGQVTILAFQDDPHNFQLSIDGAGLSSPSPNNQLAPRGGMLEANFTPGGTGAPNTTTSTSSNGVTTTTTTDATGNVIYREVDNADGTREVEIYQIGGQPFTSTDRTYDASGNVTTATLYKADGTVYLSGTGVLNADGTTTVSLVDGSGLAGGFEIDQSYRYYEPGATAVTLYVAAGEPFPAVESDYNPQGILQSRKYFDASGALYQTETVSKASDGTTVGNIYNLSGSLVETQVTGIQGQPYVETDTMLDSAGHPTTVTHYAADGSVYDTGTATTNAAGTTTIVFEDTSGAVIEQDILNSDGSKQISIYNIVGEPYASSVTNYAADGSLLSQTLLYSSGSTYQSTTRDPVTGTTTILDYDASGNLTRKEIDNGARDITTYGITGESYSAMEIVYDFESNVVSKTYYYNDGTKEIIEYPLPYDIGSTEKDTVYNANGQLTSQAIYNRDGSIASTETVVFNSDGSSLTQYRNGAGQLTSQEVDGADGSRDVTTYSVPGQAVPSTESVYDASETLVSATIINADGSKNATVYGITGQIYGAVQTFYDSGGQATAQSFFDQAGTLIETDTITTGSDGSTTTRYFDASGTLASLRVVHTDGTADVTAYGDEGIPYVQSVSQYNASGVLVAETSYNQDGSIAQIEVVTINSEGSTITDVSDANGNLTSRTVTAADGSYEVLSYGFSNTSYLQSDSFYDASGNLRSATSYGSDGAVDKTETETANADGLVTTNFVNATGALVEQDIENVDGSGTRTFYGIAGENYYSTVNAFDANGDTVSDTYFNNDGTRDVVTYPASGLFAEVDSHYDANGVLVGRQLFDNSGALVLTGTAVIAADGSTTIRYLDSTNTLVRVEVAHTDGTSSVTIYGVTGEPYAATQTSYDAGGNVTSESYLKADGSIYQTEAVTMNVDGSSTFNFYDPLGALLETDVDNVDGSKDMTIFSAAGQPYTSTASHYDANGVLLSQTRNSSDGTRDVFNYGVADPNFAATDSHYNSSGALVSKALLRADGSTYLLGTATADANGVITIDYQDSSGNLLRQEIDNPDGTSEIRLEQITGQPYSSTDTLFDSAGNATSETFYNSDQSIYQTATFTNYGSEIDVDYFNSSSSLIEQDRIYADGSKDVYLSNITGQPYYAADSQLNPNGSLASEKFYDLDGSIRVTLYGIANQPYASTSTVYDVYGDLQSITRLNADGTVYETGTPVQSSGTSGTTTVNYVTTAGALVSSETTLADGGSSVTRYLITGEPYTSTISNYDPNGNLTSETFLNADGSTYGSMRSVYDAGGNLASEAFFNGDGSVNHVVSLSNGTTTTEYFSAIGAVDHKSVVNHDGTSLVTQYGVTGQSYTSTESEYGASGTLTQRTLFNSDGTREVDAYGIAGMPYTSTQSQFNASGALISETFFDSDGGVYDRRTVQIGADGTTTTTDVDGSGNLVGQFVQKVDDSSVDDTYGIAGQPYKSTVSNYDSNGDLTSEIFYAADGSIYQTELVAIDTNGTTTTTFSNADGSVADTNVVAADGSSALTIYGITGEPYTSIASSYDSNGDLTSEMFERADGSVYETDAVTETTNPDGSTTVTYVSSNGTTRTYTYGADGTLETTGQGPAVVITSAAETSNVAMQIITGAVTSGGGATVVGQTVTLTDNGTTLGTAIVQADGSFSTLVTLPNQGANAIVAALTDGNGNTGTSAAVVDTLDNVAPTATITSAAEASKIADQTITGTVTSGGAATVVGQTVTLTDNGTAIGTATVQSDGTFSAAVTLPNQGPNSIVAMVTDSYGNTGTSAAVADTLDNIPPTVTVTSAAEASSNANQTIAGVVATGGAATVIGQTVTLTDNGTTLATTVVQADGGFSTSITLPNQGNNSIVATVTDSYGNAGTSAAVVDTLDNVPPTVTITSAAEASSTAAQTITGKVVSGSAAFVVGQTVSLTDNGVAIGTATVQSDGTFSAAVTLPNQGSNSIVATVTDSYGNTGSSAAVVDTLGDVTPTADFGSALSSAAVFGFSGGNWTVTVGGETDTLHGIERIQFADKAFELVDQFGAGVGGYQSVQAAVDQASGGETILIAPGTYTETKIPAPYSSTSGGLYIDTPNLTLQGVAADGTFITSAAQAQTSGPTIVSGAETDFGSNLFIGPDASGTTIQGLHLAAGATTTNKLVESWGNNFTIENSFIDTFYNGADTGAAAIYIDAPVNPISQYLIEGNILNEGIYVANAVGTAAAGISTTQVISNNLFDDTFDDSSGNGRYDMVAVQGQIPGVAWQPNAAQVPTLTGNTRADNASPFIFRMTEANPALFPSAGEIATILAQNTDASSSYAYVLNPDGTLHLVDSNNGSGDFKRLYVANGLDTLNQGLTAPNGIYGSARDTIDAGDTIVLQSFGATVDDVVVDGLTIRPTASSTGLTLDLGSGVRTLTLADYNAGQGAGVTVVGNNLGDTLKANSGNDTLIGGTGNDTFVAGSGNDVLTGGGGNDVYQIGSVFGRTLINNSAADGTTAPAGEVDFGAGVTDQQLWFVRSGNDLQVDLLGTSDQLTISGWYSDARAQVQSFNMANGLKLDSEVAQLVSAMATYAANNPAFDPATATQMPSDGALQNAISAAWHGDEAVEITSAPEAGNNPAQTISGTVASLDGTSVVGQTVTLTDNGATLTTTTVQSDGSFSASVILPNQGTNSLVARVIDSHGNIASSTAVVDTVDNVSPTVTITSAAETSNVASQTIAGTALSGGTAAVVGQTVTLTDNGTTLATTTVQSDGSFSVQVTLPNQGANSIVAALSDSYGNTGASAAVVDTLANVGLTVSIDNETLTNDTGASSTDFVTKDGNVALSGSVSAGSTVAIFDGTTNLGAASVSGTNWSFSADLGEGTHQLHAVATDAGGDSASSAAAHTIVVDDTPPQPSITGISPHGLLQGLSEANSSVQVFQGTTLLGSTTANAQGAWSIDASSLPTGLYSFTVTATDLAGNVGTASVSQYPVNAAIYAITNSGSYVWGSGAVDLPWQQDGVTALNFGTAYSASQLYMQADNYGNLTLKFIGDSTDSILLRNDLTNNAGVVTSGVSQLVFGDGTVSLGGTMTFTWLGNSSGYTINGSNLGSNVYEATAGGKINFGNNSAVGSTNIVEFDKGSQNVAVEADGNTGILQLGPNISAQDVYWQSNGSGDLILNIQGDSTDSVNFWRDLRLNGGLVTSAIKTVRFSDGTSIDMSHGPSTFTWLGNTFGYTLNGSNLGSNLFEATAGGKINFSDNSAVGGTNIVQFDKGSQNVAVQANGVSGILELGPQISSQDMYWQSNGAGDLILNIRGDSADSLNFWGDLQLNNGVVTSAIKTVKFSDGTSIDMSHGPSLFTWIGNAPGYTLNGSNLGSNLFEATAGGKINFGNNSAVGGTNIVEFGRGSQNVAVEADGNSGILELGPGISAQDVYWQSDRSGNLILNIRGDSADSVDFWGDLQVNNGVVTSAIKTVTFSDGTSLDISHGPSTFTWIGNAPGYTLNGTSFGTNVYEATAGGKINFGNNGAVGGTNIVEFDKGSQNVAVEADGNSGILELGPQISAQDVYWQSDRSGDLILNIRGDSADSVNFWGDLQLNNGVVSSAIQTVKFSDGTSIDMSHGPSIFTWLGNTSGYTLNGTNFGTNIYEATAGGKINFGNNSAVGSTNIVKFDRGSQNVAVESDGISGILQLGPGISAQDVYWQSDRSGDLILNIRGDSADNVNFWGDLQVNNGVVTSAIKTVQFSDGTSLDISHGPTVFTWIGDTSGYTLNGTSFGTNVYEATAGGKINFGNNSAVGGTNIVEFDKGSQNVAVEADGNSGILELGPQIAAQNVYWQSDRSGDLVLGIRGDSADSVNFWGDLQVNNGAVSSAIKTVKFSDGSSIDMSSGPSTFTWLGQPGSSLSGISTGPNSFELNGGSETATGGNNGNNTYLVSSATGQAVIYPNEAAGSYNELDFGGSITDQNLWFAQSGNDLTIDLLGTNTNVTVKGWFSSSSNQMQEIKAGGLEVDNHVSQLVQAMATYSTNNGGFDPTSSSNETLPNDAALQNAVSGAWHTPVAILPAS